ncbi:MAG TPA: aminomethyl-transferring glycine dehydrogenase subunit GcvPA [Thermoplasmata archaeon]
MKEKHAAHPYIPNSVSEVKREMLREIGAKDADDLYAQMIPERLRLRRPMDLPEPILSESDLRRHVAGILAKNRTCKDGPSFLGGGCWQHQVPVVCDEIAGRAEFLTAYSGEYYSDLGRFQSYFEFQSLMAELVDMDVVSVPTYDWGTAAGHAVRMAARITRRKEVVVLGAVSPSRLSILRNFCQLEEMRHHIAMKTVGFDKRTGMIDTAAVEKRLSEETAAVYFENPSYLGLIEAGGQRISDVAHELGAQVIVGVDPMSLGMIVPPSHYGADIVCGEIQPLGIHMNCGGGMGGFIASRDEEQYIAEYPLHLISIAPTGREGEFGFGYCRFDRSSYIARDKAKDWVGTSSGLWSIVSAVYLSLMGPEGMKEVGEAIIQKSHYAAEQLSKIKGVKVAYEGFFKEFVVNFDGTSRSVASINKALLRKGIHGGLDLSTSFPELGQSALYSVTEMHTKEDIGRLADSLREVLE